MKGCGEELEVVLDELETRQIDLEEGHVIRTSGVAGNDPAHPDVMKRSHPGLEDRSGRVVSLQVDAPEASVPVHVEVHREVFVVGEAIAALAVAEGGSDVTA